MQPPVSQQQVTGNLEAPPPLPPLRPPASNHLSLDLLRPLLGSHSAMALACPFTVSYAGSVDAGT